MTQAQEQPEQPEVHSRWMYTGETEGTVIYNGTPIANVVPGEAVDATDEAHAEQLLKSGHFEQLSGPAVAAPTAQPTTEPETLNAPQAPAAFSYPPTPQPTEQPAATGGTE